jgi:soluble lytic murein transglycosylase-like protein
MIKKYTPGFLALCVISLSSPLAQADIYKYVDSQGRVYFTDSPNHAGYKLIAKTWKWWAFPRRARNLATIKNRKIYGPAIQKVAMKYRLPHQLIHAVVTAESAYNPTAVSRAGAVGLMQLMPDTAKRYRVLDPRDPLENLHGGTHYLRDLLIMFDNDIRLALAAYNAGENAVIKYGFKIPPYEETQTYVKKVLEYYKRYQDSSKN